MGRTDIAWAGRIDATVGGGSAAFALGAPDGELTSFALGQAATFAGWQRASYEGLAELLGATIAGDRVTPELLASADVIAFEQNGSSPAYSGGWESCDWEFRDSQGTLVVHWSEATVGDVYLGSPVPRDPHVVANGSITGAAYGAFFGIPAATITQFQPTLPPESIVVSFLLFRVRGEIDVTGPAFSLTVRGVPKVPGSQESTPDPDALGVLLHPAASPATPSAPRKPKRSAARKVKELCRAIGVEEAILPAIAAMWERRAAGQPSRNDFEGAVYAAFDGLGPDRHAAMARGFAGYRAFRDGGTDACFFSDRLASAVSARPLERDEFVMELLREGAAVAADQRFPGSGGVQGPGLVRPWQHGLLSVDGSEKATGSAPWPWLTAIRPDPSSITEFGNLASFRPVPPETRYTPQGYQFDQTCRLVPDPAGRVTMECERVRRTATPGLIGPSYCAGGAEYTIGDTCLRIPSQQAGGSIRLRGFNFIAPSVTVHLKSLNDPQRPPLVQECPVWGDRETPLADERGTIIDLRVRDWADVPIPSEDPLRPGAPFPPGLYDVWVTVRDATEPAAVVVRESNRLVLRVEPGANVHFLLRSDRGRCIEATAGPGDDEIWWDALVGHVAPNTVPVDGTGTTRLELRDLTRQPFPRGPWEDMEDGKATTHTCDLFGPGAFERGGVVCVAIIGFEVDSEPAAREQLQGFANAYFEGLKAIVTPLAAFEAGAAGFAQLAVKAGVLSASTALTAALIAGVVVAAVTLISVGFWAAWAPADLVALDILTLDARAASEQTDPRWPRPADTTRRFGGHDVLVSVAQRALPKQGNPGELAVTWVQENEYATGDSRYALEFRLTRTTV